MIAAVMIATGAAPVMIATGAALVMIVAGAAPGDPAGRRREPRRPRGHRSDREG